MEERGFTLIVVSVDETKLKDVAPQFANVFSLDKEIANKMLKSAPIVFLTNVSREKVKTMAPNLLELSTNGIEFRLTKREVKDLEVLRVCPKCGETFILKKLRIFSPPQEIRELEYTKDEVAAPYQKDAVLEIGEFEPVEEPKNDYVTSQKIGKLGTQALSGVGAGKVEDIPQVQETKNIDGGVKSSLPTEGEFLINQQSVESGQIKSQPILPIKAETKFKGEYNFFIPQVTDETKRQEVAGLIASIKNISQDEALRLTNRIIIPVLKKVSKEEAEKVSMEFIRKAGIRGTITKST